MYALSRDQAKLGHDVVHLTISGDDEQPLENVDRFRIVRVDSDFTILQNSFSSELVNYVQNNDFDVIHVHSHLYFSSNLVALLSRFGDTPLAITNHGLISSSVPRWFAEIHLRTIGKFTFSSADLIFCYTNTDSDRIREIGVSTPVEIIPNGVDVDRFRPIETSKQEFVLDDRKLNVLFVGRLVDGKNPEDVIKAASIIDGDKYHFYICGDGPLRGELESLTQELGVQDCVHFLGGVPNRDMPIVYSECDLFVLPSRAEGFPRSLLEAMASGLPVITTDLEQYSDIVPKVGETVPIADPDSIADSISRISSNSSLFKEYSEQARELVEEHYSWKKTVDDTTTSLMNLVTT